MYPSIYTGGCPKETSRRRNWGLVAFAPVLPRQVLKGASRVCLGASEQLEHTEGEGGRGWGRMLWGVRCGEVCPLEAERRSETQPHNSTHYHRYLVFEKNRQIWGGGGSIFETRSIVPLDPTPSTMEADDWGSRVKPLDNQAVQTATLSPLLHKDTKQNL